MCGIFGVFAKSTSQYDSEVLSPVLKRLAVLSESRGKESSGFSFWNERQKEIQVLRAPIAVSEMLQDQKFTNILSQNLLKNESLLNGNGNGNGHHAHPFAVIGHSRLVTNGTQLEDQNNQPVIKGGVVGVHNGIIVNVNQLWEKYPELDRTSEVDTEVMLAIFRYYLEKTNSLKAAALKTFQDVFGTVATALVFEDLHKALIATNNGSLYILTNDKDILIFASEKYILRRLAVEESLPRKLGDYRITQVQANTGIVIDLDNFTLDLFEISFNGVKFEPTDALLDDKFKINLSAIAKNGNGNGKHKVLDSLVDLAGIAANPRAATERKMLEFNIDEIKQLKRCTKCLLPETFPFLSFDEKGVCNICHNYVKKNQPKPIENLINLVSPYRRNNGEADCIVPYSGGRDSTYVLHYVKKELGLNPIALTYDWGMVTDLARRNIARVCSRLGVENIIVSADIRMKRDNIRKNISAWLKYPHLGMIPLFMAGDKYFFYHTKQIKKQTGIDLNIWGINYLENTDFKVGFAGLAPQFNKKRIYSLSFVNQVKLFSFVGKNLLKSPGYINSSIPDTLGSFFVRYLFPKKDYYHLFDYMAWDEKSIEQTILNEYDWETAIDTNSTWRIGDGTASFYNYIYYTVAGFSENDTFRSNQIREGMISREEGLRLLEEENRPRYETLKWYLEIIGLDYDSTIKVINNIPKRYGH